MPFWTLLTSRLAGPILGAIALLSLIGNLGLGAGLYFEKRANGKLEDRVTRLASDNGTLRANNATLNAAVTTQNSRIDDLKRAADDAVAAARAEQAAHEAAAASHDAKAAALKNAQPAPGVDHCAAASALIRKEFAQ